MKVLSCTSSKIQHFEDVQPALPEAGAGGRRGGGGARPGGVPASLVGTIPGLMAFLLMHVVLKICNLTQETKV